jgi:ribosome-binding protein aMBF1 (putative translation factor)
MKAKTKGGRRLKSGARLIPHEQVRDRLLSDPETRFHFDRLQIGRQLGDVIAAARRNAKLTQLQVARRAGTSQPYVASLEAGRRVPSFSTLNRIANAVGLRLTLGFQSGRPA